DRSRHRRGNVRQPLPLRHLRPHPRCDPRRRPRSGDLTMTAHDANVSRRSLLKGAGALVIGLHLPLAARAQTGIQSGAGAAFRPGGNATFAPNAFVRVAPDSTVTVLIKHIEFGQGPFTGLATLVAEEMDAAWSQMRSEHAPADVKLYANLAFGVQGTGG